MSGIRYASEGAKPKTQRRKRRKHNRKNKNAEDIPYDQNEVDKVIPNKKTKFEDNKNVVNSVNSTLNEIVDDDLSGNRNDTEIAKSSPVSHRKNDDLRPKLYGSVDEHETGSNGAKDNEPDFRKGKHRQKIVSFYEEEDGEDDFFVPRKQKKANLEAKANELLEVRQLLPIYQHKDKIVDYIRKNQVVIIIGETGSGKSTQIPQFLMQESKGQIAVTQPRRVAAASLAARVSDEFGCMLGQEVGYLVRFASIISRQTKLRYLTDGMLLREIMLDQTLSKYSEIIIDEAHERTILTDLILGFLKNLIISNKRKDLKIIVMSATLNAELFSKFFCDAPILFIEGKTYPVTKYYLADPIDDIVDSMIRNIVQVNMGEQEGDILCFLPGQEEIDNCVNRLQQMAPHLPKSAPLIVPLPLYAALSPSQQLKIFELLPKNKRKVILATNIAETSITVSGVKYVIDSGLRKVKVWRHQLGLSTLLTTPISKASARQRAGRAGRECPGKVFRLYTEEIYAHKLPAQLEPEIMRNDIVLPILTLKKLGVDDLIGWSWLEHPGERPILSALTTLYSLGALDETGKITELGKKISILPLPPQLSVVLLSASERGVLVEVIDIISCLSVDNLILNVSDGNGELRDEVNMKRRAYCPLGCILGDLIALKEYFDHFRELSDLGKRNEAKSWCKELHISYKGFQTVMRVRSQLRSYMLGTIKQDHQLASDTKEAKLRRMKLLFDNERINLEADDVARPLDLEAIFKSFLKGFVTNTAIGMPDRSYRACTSGQLISIHPSSLLFGRHNIEAILYIEYVFTTKGYARNCSVIKLDWLQEIAPQLLGASKYSIN